MTKMNTTQLCSRSMVMRTLSLLALASLLGAPATADGIRLMGVQDGPPIGVRSSSSIMTRGADGTTFELRLENGDVAEARLNGEAIPADRVRQTPDGVEVLDEKGAVIHRFAGRFGAMAPSAPAAPRTERRGGVAVPGGIEIQEFRDDESRDARAAGAKPQSAVAQPSSMLGVGFGEVDEALAYHLGLADRTKCTLIAEVMDGLPAKTAGLQRFDVVTAINGTESAAVEALRDRIAKAAPGTRFSLTVRRGAETKAIDVETIAFDATKLGARAEAALPDAGGTVLFFVGPDGKRRELRLPAMQGLDLGGLDLPDLTTRLREGAEGVVPDGIDPMMRDLSRTMEEFQKRMQQWEQRFGQRFRGAPEGGAPREGPAESPRDRRFREMEERLEELMRDLRRERDAGATTQSLPDA